MKKVLMIAPLGLGEQIVGGAIAKNRCIFKYYSRCDNVILIDTYWMRKNILQYVYEKFIHKAYWIIKICFVGKIADAIILGSNEDNNISILKFIGILEKTSLFAIGGIVPERLRNSKHDIKTWKKLRAIYVESEDMAKELHLLGLNNVSFLPNFKYLPNYKTIKRANRDILEIFYHGRICKDKGMDCMMEALRLVNSKRIRVKAFLYGKFEGGWSIPEDLKDVVTYGGVLNLVDGFEDYNQLRKHDIYIFPSKWKAEGLSSSLYDALAVGKPIIATRHNLNDKIVNDGYNGYLFDVDDSGKLAELITVFIKNKKLIVEMGMMSLKKVNMYRVENLLSAIEL